MADLLDRGRIAWLLAATLASGCVTSAQCDTRIDAAHRDALRDAEICHWNPDGLFLPDCGGLDRRPRFTYEGVWCATATLTCIRSIPDADAACFGAPAE